MKAFIKNHGLPMLFAALGVAVLAFLLVSAAQASTGRTGTLAFAASGYKVEFRLHCPHTGDCALLWSRLHGPQGKIMGMRGGASHTCHGLTSRKGKIFYKSAQAGCHSGRGAVDQGEHGIFWNRLIAFEITRQREAQRRPSLRDELAVRFAIGTWHDWTDLVGGSMVGGDGELIANAPVVSKWIVEDSLNIFRHGG